MATAKKTLKDMNEQELKAEAFDTMTAMQQAHKHLGDVRQAIVAKQRARHEQKKSA